MHFYGEYEYEFEASVAIKQIAQVPPRYSVDFTFTKKRLRKEETKQQLQETEKCSKTDFSKGKKIVYVMCVILAMNSTESVK